MDNSKSKKLSLWTVVFLIVVPTYGFTNITNNVVAIGTGSILSWIIVSVLFFLPLSLFIAELGSVEREGKEGSAGIYSWIELGLGEKWAFIGTWGYFVSTLFYLQMVYARIPVMISWTIFGENRFSDSSAMMIPLISAATCVILTIIASKGVTKFSKISDIGGKLTLAITVLFVVFGFIGAVAGKPVATDFAAEGISPKFDVSYFATFSWLLLAVAGAEVGGTYVKNMKNPEKHFSKAIYISTALIAISYILGSVAVLFVASPETISKAGIKDAGYVVYRDLANSFGLNGQIVIRIYALIFTVSSVAAYVVWMESPLRALFSEVPRGTFPEYLTKQEEDGTLKNALWIQCAIELVLILTPLLGLSGLDNLFNFLTDLSALSSVPAYALLAFAYFRFKSRNEKSEYVAIKNRSLALVMALVTFIIGVLAYIGAGLDYVMYAETKSEAIKLIIQTYGGPIILVLIGWGLRSISLRKYDRRKA